EALVMHAGDKPYVVAPSGQVELASKGLTLDAVNGIVSQLLPPDVFNALDEFGAIQHELAAQPGFTGESFTVVAARGGDDVWVEIRRRKIPDDDRVPDDLFGAPSPTAAVAVTAAVDDSIPDLDVKPAAAATVAPAPVAPVPVAPAPVAAAPRMPEPVVEMPLAVAPAAQSEDDDLSLSLPD